MRVTTAEGYHENRDNLAQDWSTFLGHFTSSLQWMSVPNIGFSVREYAKTWGLNGFVLSGGEDVGTNIERDSTEITLIDYAAEQGLPVLGVCRGLQLMNMHFGQSSEEGPQNLFKTEDHIAKNHLIISSGQSAFFGEKGTRYYVNSFHQNLIRSDQLSDDFDAAAYDEAGNIEAAVHKRLPVAGIMWHPERDSPDSKINHNVFKLFFCLG